MEKPEKRDLVAQYERSHQHPVNRACHTVGIPTIVLALAMGVAALVFPVLWWPAIGLFTGGWLLQFIGHWFEKKPPEFFNDWRFLFVGLQWWLLKIRGRTPATTSTNTPGSTTPRP